MISTGNSFLFAMFILGGLFCFPVSAFMAQWNTTPPGGVIADLALSDDGSRIVVGTTGGLGVVYDQDGNLLWQTSVPGIVLVGCRGNGSAVILASREDLVTNKGALRFYNQTGEEQWYANTGAVEALDLPARSNRIVIGNRMGETIVFNDLGEEIARFNEKPRNSVIADLSVSDDGKVFSYSAYEQYPVVRYVTIDPKKKSSFKSPIPGEKSGVGSDPAIDQLEISSDGKFIVTAGGEGGQGLLTLYAKNGSVLWSKKMDSIRDIAITRNGSFVFSGSTGGNISCYAQTGNLSWVYPVNAEVTSLSLVPDKELFAAGNARGDIFLFNATGSLFNTLVWTEHISEFPSGEISKVRLSRDGTALVVAYGKKLYYFGKEPDNSTERDSIAGTSPLPTPVVTPKKDIFFLPGLTKIWNTWKNLTAPLWQP
jgi:outer membrane protein assembly factor BamB